MYRRLGAWVVKQARPRRSDVERVSSVQTALAQIEKVAKEHSRVDTENNNTYDGHVGGCSAQPPVKTEPGRSGEETPRADDQRQQLRLRHHLCPQFFTANAERQSQERTDTVTKAVQTRWRDKERIIQRSVDEIQQIQHDAEDSRANVEEKVPRQIPELLGPKPVEKARVRGQKVDFRLRMAKNTKDAWNDSKLSKRMKERWMNPNFRRRMSEKRKEMWKNPSYRDRITEKRKQTWQDPDFRANSSERTKEMWKNPHYRHRMIKTRKEAWENPELRRRMSEAIKSRWRDPEYRRRQRESRKKSFWW